MGKKFTVLLLYPDYMNDGGAETIQVHSDGKNAMDAGCKAKSYACLKSNGEADSGDDFQILAIYQGHIEDLYEGGY